MARNCRGHPHPRRKKPVKRVQVRGELRRMLSRAGRDGDFSLDWTDDLARTHDRNQRRYAQVAPFANAGPAFELAPQTVHLPTANRRGLLAHEVGHVLAPRGSEDDADRAAAEALGIEIGYDDRWPGKGLQVALNPPAKGSNCDVLTLDNQGNFVWARGKLICIEEGLAHVKVGRKTIRVYPKHVRNCPPPERRTASGRTRVTREGKAPPPWKWVRELSGKHKQIVRLSMVSKSDPSHLIASVKYRNALHSKKAYIMTIDVDPNYRGRYLATKLYEKVAREVWREGRQLFSDLELRVGSRGFWEKQVKKGRAEWQGKRYALRTPPPRTLKNPGAPKALWGAEKILVDVLGPAWEGDDRYFLIVAPWGEEVVAVASELYDQETGRPWREIPPSEGGRRAWANPPAEFPILPASAFEPVPVPTSSHYPPINLDPQAAAQGLVPLAYMPEGVREKPLLRRAHQALLERLPSGEPRAFFYDPWEDLLSQTGTAATVYVLDQNGWLWKLVEVLRDPGPYGTGRLVLQAQGPLARRWPNPIVRPIQHVVASGSVPIVHYKPLRRGAGLPGPRQENPPREWKTPPPCDPKATGRQLDVKSVKGDSVRVHVNLHNGCYVVSSRGLVAGYAKALTLKNVLPKVSTSGWKKCSDTKTRNVHAFLQGEFGKASAPKPKGKAWRKISYNCKERGPNFYYTDDGSVFEGAEEVRFCRKKGVGVAQIAVYAKGKPPRKSNPGCGCGLPGGACRCGAVDRWWLEDPPGCGCP